MTKIAQHLKVSSSLISHIISGEKSLTPEQACLLISYLGLVGLEADYFTYLVNYERSGSKELRQYWKAKLDDLEHQSLKLSNRLKSEAQLTEEKKSVFYSSPLYMMIRLYTSVGNGGKSLAEIAQRFHLSMLSCSEIMNFLVQAGLCHESNGYFSMAQQSIHLEKSSPYLRHFHSDWRMQALKRLEDLHDSELMFTAPVSLSKEDFALLREEVVLFIQNFLRTIHASPAEDIACMNLDFFWIKK